MALNVESISQCLRILELNGQNRLRLVWRLSDVLLLCKLLLVVTARLCLLLLFRRLLRRLLTHWLRSA